MKLKSYLVVIMLWLGMAGAEAAEQVKYSVVIQVSEDSVERLMLALNTAKYVQQEYGAANVNVEVVIYGPGVQTMKFYAPIPVADRVKQAKYNGVKIAVCDQSMRAAKLRPSDMLKEISFVRSGATEIIEKTHQGWAYLRP